MKGFVVILICPTLIKVPLKINNNLPQWIDNLCYCAMFIKDKKEYFYDKPNNQAKH